MLRFLFIGSNGDLILVENRNLSAEVRSGLISKRTFLKLQGDTKIGAFRCRKCKRYYKDDEGKQLEIGTTYRKGTILCERCKRRRND